jgi:Terminase large subunit, T4likevirus-type, N-terminal
MKIKYNKNKAQKEFHEDCKTKFLHLSGGLGSGKSYALVMKAFQLSFINKDLPGALVCPTYTDFKRDLHPMLEEIAAASQINLEYHGQDHYYRLPWSRSKLYVATCERKIRGPNWAFAAINEATLIGKQSYMDVVGRVRLIKAKQPQIVSCGTPEGISNEFYEMFISNPMNNSKVVYASTRDNKENLGADYVQSLEDSFDEISRKAYLEGMWINMNGSLFYYSYKPEKNNWSGKDDEHSMVHIGMDFNVDPMTATMWQYDGAKLRGIDEITIGGLQGGADTKMICQAMKSRGYMPDRCIIYPDPAGNSRTTKGQPDIQILRDNGYHNIKVKSKAPGMRQRQLNVNNLLDKGVIIINPSLQPEMKKEFEGVEQDKVTLEKKKNNPARTHHSDGLDYLCDIMFPFSGQPQRSSIINIR